MTLAGHEPKPGPGTDARLYKSVNNATCPSEGCLAKAEGLPACNLP